MCCQTLWKAQGGDLWMAGSAPSNHVARVLSAANPSAAVDPESRIAVSWRRCLIDHKLDPARHGPPQTLTESEVKRIAQPVEELIRAANPELQDLGCWLPDEGNCVNFSGTK